MKVNSGYTIGGDIKHQITPKKGIHRESFQFQLIMDVRRLLTKSR